MRHLVDRALAALAVAAGVWIALPPARVPGAALVSTVAPIAEIRTPQSNAVVDGPIRVDVALGAPAARTFDFRLEVESADRPGERIPLAALEGIPAMDTSGSPDRSFGATWDPSSLPAGLYTIRLRVVDAWGALRETSVPVWVDHAEVRDPAPSNPDWDGSEDTSALV